VSYNAADCCSTILGFVESSQLWVYHRTYNGKIGQRDAILRGIIDKGEEYMNTGELAQALDTVLWHKAKRFVNSPGYIAHVRKCVDELQLTDVRLAFLFGGLDAMQQDLGSAAQMTRPPGSDLDVSSRDNRLARLKRWRNEWRAKNTLPFVQG